MTNHSYPGHKKKRKRLRLDSLLVALVLTACNAIRFGTAPGTEVVERVNPSATPWQTPAPSPTLLATSAHALCPPFSIDTALPVPDEPQRYIGLHFDTLPDGLESKFGFVISGLGTDYVVSAVGRERSEMLWLERVVCRDDNGHPYKELRAVLILPSLHPRQRLIIHTCQVKGKTTPVATLPNSGGRWYEGVTTKYVFDDEIVAIGWFEDFYQPPVTISHAWRANPRTESFEVLSPESVMCAGLVGQ